MLSGETCYCGFSAAPSVEDWVAEPMECLTWVSARCAKLNEQPLLTLRSSVRSTPPLSQAVGKKVPGVYPMHPPNDALR